MKSNRAGENVACALAIVASGMIPFTVFSLLGLHLWAWVGLGMIPFGFGCWGLSLASASLRDREICANLTESERDQVAEMARAYGRRMARWLFPGVVLPAVLIAFCVGTAFPPGGFFDAIERNQVWLVAAGLALVAALALVCLPTGIKQNRAIRNFLSETEYARRQGYSPSQR
jgi:hypothetical protein